MTDKLNIKYDLTPSLIAKLQGITRHHTYSQTILSVSKQKDKILRILQAGQILSATGIDTSLRGPRGVRTPEAGAGSRDIRAYGEAVQYLMQHAAKKAPLTLSLIQQLHKRLSPDRSGGNLRQVQNYVVRMPNREILHTPPKPDAVLPALKCLLSWVKSEGDADPVIVSAVVHYEIARIHPFPDGNGRVARLLASYIMLIGGYELDHTLLCADRFFLENRRQYYEELLGADDAKDLNRWIEYIAEAWLQSYARLAESSPGDVAENRDFIFLSHEMEIPMAEIARNVGYVDQLSLRQFKRWNQRIRFIDFINVPFKILAARENDNFLFSSQQKECVLKN